MCFLLPLRPELALSSAGVAALRRRLPRPAPPLACSGAAGAAAAAAAGVGEGSDSCTARTWSLHCRIESK